MCLAAIALLLLTVPRAGIAAAPFAAPAAPRIPDGTFNVIEFGATSDGVTDTTDAIKRAIDACKKAGGGKSKVRQSL